MLATAAVLLFSILWMGNTVSLSSGGLPALRQQPSSSTATTDDEQPPPPSSTGILHSAGHHDGLTGEEDPDELVIQAWAYCKAKPAPLKFRSFAEERRLKESRKWRGRQSFTELDCGEDSFFIAKHSRAIGVADGVGGWRSRGVDPSEFSNALMQHAKAFTDSQFDKQEDKNNGPALDPQRIIAVAHKRVIDEHKVKAGSSTACVATLIKNPDGTHELDVANVGDSGMLLVRNQKQIFRAKEGIHAFNTPYQLAVLPPQMKRRSISDSAADCTRERVKVEEGDVIVMGTDGLFDNRFGNHLAADAGWVNADRSTSKNSAFLSTIPVLGSWLGYAMGGQTVAFTDPYRVARRLVMDASTNSLSKTASTPWSVLLKQEGVAGAAGGKSDDITVVLGRIGRRGVNSTGIPTF